MTDLELILIDSIKKLGKRLDDIEDRLATLEYGLDDSSMNMEA
jgi:hypothetical protein